MLASDLSTDTIWINQFGTYRGWTIYMVQPKGTHNVTWMAKIEDHVSSDSKVLTIAMGDTKYEDLRDNVDRWYAGVL